MRALVALALAGAALAACSQRDTTVGIDPDDAEMVAAIEAARNTLPAFWTAFDTRPNGESDFVLKVKITDRHGAEHFWVNDITRRDGKITGTIDNDPNVVAAVKVGDRIEVREADITDWAYTRGGKMVGNRTLRVLFKKMPAAEVEGYKRQLADP